MSQDEDCLIIDLTDEQTQANEELMEQEFRENNKRPGAPVPAKKEPPKKRRKLPPGKISLEQSVKPEEADPMYLDPGDAEEEPEGYFGDLPQKVKKAKVACSQQVNNLSFGLPECQLQELENLARIYAFQDIIPTIDRLFETETKAVGLFGMVQATVPIVKLGKWEDSLHHIEQLNAKSPLSRLVELIIFIIRDTRKVQTFDEIFSHNDPADLIFEEFLRFVKLLPSLRVDHQLLDLLKRRNECLQAIKIKSIFINRQKSGSSLVDVTFQQISRVFEDLIMLILQDIAQQSVDTKLLDLSQSTTSLVEHLSRVSFFCGNKQEIEIDDYAQSIEHSKTRIALMIKSLHQYHKSCEKGLIPDVLALPKPEITNPTSQIAVVENQSGIAHCFRPYVPCLTQFLKNIKILSQYQCLISGLKQCSAVGGELILYAYLEKLLPEFFQRFYDLIIQISNDLETLWSGSYAGGDDYPAANRATTHCYKKKSSELIEGILPVVADLLAEFRRLPICDRIKEAEARIENVLSIAQQMFGQDETFQRICSQRMEVKALVTRNTLDQAPQVVVLESPFKEQGKQQEKK